MAGCRGMGRGERERRRRQSRAVRITASTDTSWPGQPEVTPKFWCLQERSWVDLPVSIVAPAGSAVRMVGGTCPRCGGPGEFEDVVYQWRDRAIALLDGWPSEDLEQLAGALAEVQQAAP